MDVDPEVVEEGTKLVEQLLKTWAGGASGQDDEDIVMADDEEDLGDPEAQLVELKKCFEQFRPQLEGNAWVKQVLSTLA